MKRVRSLPALQSAPRVRPLLDGLLVQWEPQAACRLEAGLGKQCSEPQQWADCVHVQIHAYTQVRRTQELSFRRRDTGQHLPLLP